MKAPPGLALGQIRFNFG